MEKMSPWARDYTALLSLDYSDGRSMWKVYLEEVLPLASDTEKGPRYASNYEKFTEQNCTGCKEYLPACGYLKGSGDRKEMFIGILDGEAEECSYKVAKIRGAIPHLR